MVSTVGFDPTDIGSIPITAVSAGSIPAEVVLALNETLWYFMCMKDFKSIGKTVEGNEGDKCNYPTRLDTYGCGCQHDCSYCYAKSLLDFRDLWNPKNPSVANISDISKAIKKLLRKVIRLCGMTAKELSNFAIVRIVEQI